MLDSHRRMIRKFLDRPDIPKCVAREFDLLEKICARKFKINPTMRDELIPVILYVIHKSVLKDGIPEKLKKGDRVKVCFSEVDANRQDIAGVVESIKDSGAVFVSFGKGDPEGVNPELVTVVRNG